MDLNGKGVLITGGSRGLGAALGRELAVRGAKVVLVARDRGPLEATVQSIRTHGGDAHAIVGDIADKHDIHRIAGAAAELVGPIDVLIQNASTLGPTPLRLLLDTECEDFEHVLAVNLVGPFRLAKVVAGSMLLRRTGVIVSISSDAGVEAYPTWGAYGASKAALDHLTRTLAAELASSSVRAFAIDPGEMDTKMHEDALGPAEPGTLADPNVVAVSIANAIERDDLAPNGARITAASVRQKETSDATRNQTA